MLDRKIIRIGGSPVPLERIPYLPISHLDLPRRLSPRHHSLAQEQALHRFPRIDVDQPALDNGDAHARSRETSRQKRPGLSDADDNRIECDHSSLHGQRVRWDAPLDRRGKIINKMYLMSSGL